MILYGRNDSYGYNLHKRAALSLNCMAEVLTGEGDEILFVDYNTPDDYPTFPEAIEDTLTEKARKMLRIFRVRPSIHARFVSKTHLKALEPISRNIAARRSNPANRWILSTNTDMIFVPRTGESLTELVRDLNDGYWAVPRFEIPESLWEGFDRKDPVATIKSIEYWGRAAHLNEIVLGADENLYDAPGDFQLIQRDVFFRINGFDERMLLGWHVDSNIAKRLWLIYGRVSDLGQKIYGYHCDHTRQITPMHSHKSVENDLECFVSQVNDPVLDQEWGCPGDAIEEIRLGVNSASRIYVGALRKAIETELTAPTLSLYRTEGYDKVDYDPDHVVSFLADLFVNAPRHVNLAWFGFRRDTLKIFLSVWASFGFSGKILLDRSTAMELLDDDAETKAIRVLEQDDILVQADVFVVDFGIFRDLVTDEISLGENDSVVRMSGNLVESFFKILESEYDRMGSGEKILRRVVAVNAFHNRFESLVRNFVGTARTPFSTRIQQGFLLPPFVEEDLLPKMHLGSSARRIGEKIQVLSERGPAVYGPYLFLLPGRYQLRCWVDFGTYENTILDGHESYIEVAICYGMDLQEKVDFSYIFQKHQSSEEISLIFDVPKVAVSRSGSPATYEFRLYTDGRLPLNIRSMRLKRTGSVGSSPSFLGEELLSRMTVGPSALRAGEIVRILPNQGWAVFGPYLVLLPGRYRFDCLIEFKTLAALVPFGKRGSYLEIAVSYSDEHQERVVFLPVSPERGRSGRFSLDFDVPKEVVRQSGHPVFYEFRLWTDGRLPMELRSMKLKRIGSEEEI